MGNEVLMEFGIIALWMCVVWAIVEWRKMTHKSRLQHKILDKFNTVPELNDFLQSSGGDKFLDFLTIKGFGLKEKLLSSVSKGVIVLFVGIAFIFIGPLLTGVTRDSGFFRAVGIIGIAVGLGFLVSTFISYKLSQKWGIIDTEKMDE